jgi:hypothetical protein
MSGAIPPLPNTPSWRGAYLKHRDNFTFTFTMRPLHSLFIIAVPFLLCRPMVARIYIYLYIYDA